VISVLGVGETEYLRRSGRSVQMLGIQAARHALADAGIEPRFVDGVIPLGGSLFAEDLIAGLGLRTDIADAQPAPGGNSAVASLGLAQSLIDGGLASVVLIVFARNGSSENRIANRIRLLPGQQFRHNLEDPHGWSTPAAWYAMICRRHMAEHGTSKAQLAAVAMTMRQYGRENPRAMLRDRPLSLEDYLAGRMIADPYQRDDCCLETDGAAAVLVAARGREKLTDRQGIRLLAVASARPESPDDLTNRADWYRIGLSTAAPAAYESAGLGPEDMDLAMIYDCFTFEVIHQLEEAGFCSRGDGGEFVASGAAGLGGKLPVNTHGGLLAEGHLGGLNHVLEAVRQLRGEAGSRQVAGARLSAVTGWGDWGDGSLAILGSRR
jgi:acetyl-CoA acetyltransferase